MTNWYCKNILMGANETMIMYDTAWEQRPALTIFVFIYFFIIFNSSVIFTGGNLVGSLRGATSCMKITAKAAGMSDPKDRRGIKQPFEGGMKFTVKLQIWFPWHSCTPSFSSPAMLCLQHIGNWNMQRAGVKKHRAVVVADLSNTVGAEFSQLFLSGNC